MVSWLLLVSDMSRSTLVILFAIGLAACGSTSQRDGGTVPRDAGADTRDGGTTSTDAGPDRDAGVARDAGSTPDPTGLCPTGSTLERYSLASLPTLPPSSALALPDQPAFLETLMARDDGVGSSVRFDVCRDGSGVELRAVLYYGDSFGFPIHYVYDDTITVPVVDYVDIAQGMVEQVRLPADDWIVTGLDAAIGGDLASLRARLTHTSGLIVHGHAGFLAVAPGNVTATTVDYNSIYVIVGALVPGDVFAALPCPFGERPKEVTFDLDTATFEVEACTFLGGGETEGYRITKLAITDPNPMLDPSEQVRFEFDGETAVEEVLNYRWNHHNACDSFHLALPHADYAASSAPLAGCGQTVPNAPPRKFTDPPSSPVAWRIRYHGGAWREGTMATCTHYMFCR